MDTAAFVAKWRPVELRERQACQEHFIDLCRLVDHPTPVEMDPRGERFCFERGATKSSGGDGWADVWKRGYFGWEYKGKHKDLDEAYKQLNDYREHLENPPLQVVCDMATILIHTNFTNTPPTVYELTYDDLLTPEGLRKLRQVFFDPERLRPAAPRHVITEKAARTAGNLARTLRDRGVEAHSAARFLDRLVFCMFAEDVGLLPGRLFSKVLGNARQAPARLAPMLEQLFGQMAGGGWFGADEIRRFNGNLFTDATIIPLQPNEIGMLEALAAMDWAEVEPAVFGTLFERGLDPDKRAQIGAHYTSREDIETLVEPVILVPLRCEWDETRALVNNVLRTGKKAPKGSEKTPAGPALEKARTEAAILVRNFLDRLAAVKVLDPACGSGNFLYIALQKLLDLEREVLLFADAQGVGGHFPRVDPRQLHGIEINPYAYELAQMTVWIGYLQWMNQRGYPWPADPVLKPLDTFECKDAILDLSDVGNPREPDWPAVEFIVSNPPFLGGNRVRGGLGDEYVEALFEVYQGRVAPFADLCCYWFEKARKQIEAHACVQAGLLATQAIRGGVNRSVLERICASGTIFFAESDRAWVLDGANVHVSMVGFTNRCVVDRHLDGSLVPEITPRLTASLALSNARPLTKNRAVAFQGPSPKADFEISEGTAEQWLQAFGVHGRPVSDVVRPLISAIDITGRPRRLWTIDFGLLPLERAAGYEAAFEHVRKVVMPVRSANRRAAYARTWWLYAEPRPGLRRALGERSEQLITPCHSKHRVFVRAPVAALANQASIVFARADDYFFGALQSRPHELWGLRMGTRLETRPRYTPTTCFETFPFPWPPGQEPTGDSHAGAISEAAHELNELRERWLNPPEWTRQEFLEFPGSCDGSWRRFVQQPDARGIGTVRWPRVVPRDAECEMKLKTRTLTNLYNQRPAWLDMAHRRLDEAVFAAYGWPPDLTDEQLLERLLALNLERAAAEGR